jgi:hypothetical protein
MNNTETGFLFMLLVFVAVGMILFIAKAKG